MNKRRRVVVVGLLTATALITIAVLYSSFAKLAQFGDFETAVRRQGLVPETLVLAFCRTIIGIELVMGTTVLYFCTLPHKACALAPLILAVFFALVTCYCTALCIYPPEVASGCGCGFSRRLIEDWRPLAAQNGAFTVGCGLAAVIVRRWTA